MFLLFHGKKCSWKEQYNTKRNHQKALFIYFHVLEKRLLLSAHLKQHQPSPPKALLGARQHTSPWAEQTQDLYRILSGPALVVPRLFQTHNICCRAGEASARASRTSTSTWMHQDGINPARHTELTFTIRQHGLVRLNNYDLILLLTPYFYSKHQGCGGGCWDLKLLAPK